MNLEKKFFRGLTSEIREIREKVFVEEQGFVDEFDEADETAIHLVIYYDGKAVATGRTFKDDNDDYVFKGMDKDINEKTYIIGRVAVLKEYRDKKLGIKLLEFLEKKAQEKGAKKIKLSAQARAQGFYEKNGYTRQGEIYYEEFLPHILMNKTL